jgi:cell shape-determining protein MreC
MEKLSGIIASIVGLAILSVLISKKAQTSSVIQAMGTGLSQVIGAATKPVS